MILRKNKSLSFLILFFTLINLHSQVGSPYSIVGLGDVVNTSYGNATAMGGIGAGLSSSFYLNSVNPSTIVDLDSLSVIYQFGLSGGYNNLSSAATSTKKTGTRIDYFAIGFKIKEYWGLGFGLSPLTRLDYTASERGEPQGGSYYTQYYYGKGGLSKFYLTNSFRIIENLTAGIEASVAFGNIDRINLVDFDATFLTNSKFEDKLYLADFLFRYGLQYKLPLNDKKHLVFGAVYENKMKLNGTQSTYAITTLSTVYTQGIEYDLSDVQGNNRVVDTLIFKPDQKATITYPSSFTFGLTYNIKDKLTAGADFGIQQWTELNGNGIDPFKYNSTKYSAGIEFIPDSKSLNRYWKHIRYRAGGKYNNSHLEFSGQRINSYGVTFGLGFPMRGTKTTFNVSGEFGKRGTADQNLLQESYGILSLNLSLSDLWFFKQKFK